MHFLEIYMGRLEGPIAVQVLPNFVSHIREALPLCTAEKRRPILISLCR